MTKHLISKQSPCSLFHLCSCSSFLLLVLAFYSSSLCLPFILAACACFLFLLFVLVLYSCSCRIQSSVFLCLFQPEGFSRLGKQVSNLLSILVVVSYKGGVISKYEFTQWNFLRSPCNFVLIDITKVSTWLNLHPYFLTVVDKVLMKLLSQKYLEVSRG